MCGSLGSFLHCCRPATNRQMQRPRAVAAIELEPSARRGSPRPGDRRQCRPSRWRRRTSSDAWGRSESGRCRPATGRAGSPSRSRSGARRSRTRAWVCRVGQIIGQQQASQAGAQPLPVRHARDADLHLPGELHEARRVRPLDEEAIRGRRASLDRLLKRGHRDRRGGIQVAVDQVGAVRMRRDRPAVDAEVPRVVVLVARAGQATTPTRPAGPAPRKEVPRGSPVGNSRLRRRRHGGRSPARTGTRPCRCTGTSDECRLRSACLAMLTQAASTASSAFRPERTSRSLCGSARKASRMSRRKTRARRP